MARTPKKEKTQPRSIEDILNNPADKNKLIGFMDEAVRCKLLTAAQNDALKGIKEEAEEQLGLDKKLFNKIVKIAYDNSFIETRAELSALDSAIEILFEPKDAE